MSDKNINANKKIVISICIILVLVILPMMIYFENRSLKVDGTYYFYINNIDGKVYLNNFLGDKIFVELKNKEAYNLYCANAEISYKDN